MKTTLILTAAALTLSGCAMIEMPMTNTARDAAKAVVMPIVADTIPGPAGAIVAECIIDNASGDELATLAAQGASPASITLVSDILARPDTVACATTGLT